MKQLKESEESKAEENLVATTTPTPNLQIDWQVKAEEHQDALQKEATEMQAFVDGKIAEYVASREDILFSALPAWCQKVAESKNKRIANFLVRSCVLLLRIKVIEKYENNKFWQTTIYKGKTEIGCVKLEFPQTPDAIIEVEEKKKVGKKRSRRTKKAGKRSPHIYGRV